MSEAEVVPPCGAACPGDCGWNPDDPDDPCAPAPAGDSGVCGHPPGEWMFGRCIACGAGDSGGEPGGTGDDTLPQWLCQRFGSEPWETLSADDQAYWEHEAAATRRAVARNGFRAPAPAGDSGGERG